tara:strand:+ start:548 stop:946 length:399 start_codon:yes stop_codon:yes gene_type:complete
MMWWNMGFPVYNEQMKKLIITCALAILLAVVGCGGASNDTTAPVNIATATPIFSEGEVKALVQQWIIKTCNKDSFVYALMQLDKFHRVYIGDNSWKVGIKNKDTGIVVENFTVYEKSGLVKYNVVSAEKEMC